MTACTVAASSPLVGILLFVIIAMVFVALAFYKNAWIYLIPACIMPWLAVGYIATGDGNVYWGTATNSTGFTYVSQCTAGYPWMVIPLIFLSVMLAFLIFEMDAKAKR